MPKVFTSKRQKIGELGESIAVTFLINHGFSIIERNYTRPWGELDVIAERDEKIHFIEVKTVSRERKEGSSYNSYRPEENMYPLKIRKIYRTIQTYISDKQIPDSVDWQVDLVCVYLDPANRKAQVKRIENIVG